MKARQTLRGRLRRFAALTILAVGIGSILLSASEAIFSLRFKRNAIVGALLRSSKAQEDLLIPTFLLPEQARGRKLVLDRIIQDDDLASAQVLQTQDDLPEEFRGCRLSQSETSCLSARSKEVATIAPIGEPGHVFGYLFKIKRIDSALSGEQSLHAIGSMAIVLFVTFAILFLGFGHIAAREVPTQLDALVNWVEAFLANESSKRAPELAFEELNRLGLRIAELIERHERAQDQAVIGQLTSGIMHDIRTPLQSIVAAVELLRELDPATKRPDLLENLYRICSVKVPIIGQIIETTLDGNRQIHLEKVHTDIREAIEAAMSMQSDLAVRKGVKIEFAAPLGPIRARHDSAQMIRVFSNLIKNGIEAAADCPGQKRVLVSCSPRSSQAVTLTVEDSGAGISGDPGRLFRAFQSNKRHGSGLGLIVSKKIVEAHGGSLSASRSGHLSGACFVVTLPVGESIHQAQAVMEEATV